MIRRLTGSEQEPRSPPDRKVPSTGTVSIILNKGIFHLRTLWLFTVSDHKPLVYPMTLTGLLNFYAGEVLNERTSRVTLWSSLIMRFPVVIFWVWFNFLLFCVGNQRFPESVKEDSFNKPWRPIPSGRLNPQQATILWYCLHPLVLGSGTFFRSTQFTVCLLFLGFLYNNCGGGGNAFTRNVINACAVVCFSLGATVVAYGEEAFVLNAKGRQWQWIVGAIVFTTLQIQDLCDQEGDKSRGRLTIPLLVGDIPARWCVVIPMLVWSAWVPSFWTMSVYGYTTTLAIWTTISWRLLRCKGVNEDRTTYRIWGLWIACVLAMPAAS